MVGTIVLVGLKYGGKPNSEIWRRRRGGKRVNYGGYIYLFKSPDLAKRPTDVGQMSNVQL